MHLQQFIFSEIYCWGKKQKLFDSEILLNMKFLNLKTSHLVSFTKYNAMPYLKHDLISIQGVKFDNLQVLGI